MTLGRALLAGLALLALSSAGCGREGEPDCLMPPCPLPMAIVLSVTSTTGGPVPGLTLALFGAASGSGQCSAGDVVTFCVVPGPPGRYDLRLAAAGFQDKALSVTVPGSTPRCGCTSVETQRLDVGLAPS